MQRSALFFFLWLGFAAPAISADVILKSIPNAQIVGEGTLTVAFWDIYDATLYAPSGIFNQRQPFALSMRYKKEIEGADIAKRSVEEMRDQEFADESVLARWQTQMVSIFPDVQDGTVLSAVFFPGKKTVFYRGNEKIGTIADADFTRQFSNIWLSEKTSEPELRKQLLGMS